MFDRVVEELHPRAEGDPERDRTELQEPVPDELARKLLKMTVDWG